MAKYKPYMYFLLAFFVIGASLILGFLSFGGMYAMLPALLAGLPQATISLLSILLPVLAFTFTVIYEAQIYLQYLYQGLNKLFTADYLPVTYAKKFLSEYTPDTKAAGCPKFFKEYEALLIALKEHTSFVKKLDNEEIIAPLGRKYYVAKLARLKKEIGKKERWFAKQLFHSPRYTTRYSEEVQKWIRALPNKKGVTARKAHHRTLTLAELDFKLALGFSVFASIFFTIGTTYLLINTFASIPVLAAIPLLSSPFFLLPIAAIAGIAWGLLIYNTLTDFIQHKTIQNWIQKLKKAYNKGFTVKTAAIVSLTALLTGLTLVVSIFTAGTWFTIVKETSAIFSWMQYLPIQTVIAYALAMVNGLAELFFAVGNSIETLDILTEKICALVKIMNNEGLIAHIQKSFQNFFTQLQKKENWLQMLNPFRIFNYCTFHIIRVALFIGHIFGVAVSADQLGTIPPWILSLTLLFGELIQDIHFFLIEHVHKKATNVFQRYFKKEEHGHDHNGSIPDRILHAVYLIFLHPIAALWDWLASDKKNHTFSDAFYKQQGKEPHPPVKTPSPNFPKASTAWKLETVNTRLEKEQSRVFPKAKTALLHQLQQEVLQEAKKKRPSIKAVQTSIRTIDRQANHSPLFFPLKKKQQQFFDGLQERVESRASLVAGSF